MEFKGKRIILGVTGSIAVYKACEILRKFVNEGAEVHVVMTTAATKLISPVTFQTLSKKPVITTLFYEMKHGEIHIDLAQRCDLLVIAPATANTIAKMANGIADDILTTLVLAFKSPIIVAPAMNERMFKNPIVVENITKLKSLGFRVVGPEYGELASLEKGIGRLASVERIIREAWIALYENGSLKGKRILITAGPTQEPIDEVRYLTNRSSGKMGFALAEVAKEMGADVMLVSGPTSLSPPQGVEFISVRTGEEMYKIVMEEFKGVDIGIFAAAPCDFRPMKVYSGKIEKQGELQVKFIQNPDILKEIGKIKGSKLVVGFSAEWGDPIKNAHKKLKEKNLDMIVANDISRDDAGFEADTNVVTLIDRTEKIEAVEKLPKREVARRILEKVVKLMNSGGDGT